MQKHPENPSDYSLALGLKTFSKKVSLVVALVGFIVILGWVFDIPLLKGILSNLPTMKINTALCFLLGGTSLWLWHWQGKRKIQILSLSLAFLISLIALLTLLEYGFNVNLGIDEFIIQQPEPMGTTAAPGRMAPNTALAFLFEGSALLLLSVNRPNYLAAQGMAVGGGVIGFVGVLGYVYGSVYFYTAGSYTGMAMHTAIALLLLASGILCANPDRGLMPLLCGDGAGSLMARRLLPFAIFLPLLVERLSVIGYHWSFYTEQMEAALSSSLNIILFSGLVGWNAYKLNCIDKHRRGAELALQRANAFLQQANEQLQQELHSRQQAKEALRESEERWQLAIRGTNDGIWDWNVKTNEVFFSARWKEMLGYEDHEIANHVDEWAKRVHPDDLDWVVQVIQEHFAKKTPFYISEHRVLCKDGTYKWILDRGQALWDEGGNVLRMAGSHTDISDRKRAEEQLRKSEAALAEAQRVAHLGNWELDVATKKITWSDELFRIFGFDPTQPEPAYAEHFQHIYPDDRVSLEHHLNQAMTDGIPYKIDLRIWRTDGSMGCMEARGEAERDDQGRIIRLFGTALDISDRFQVEEKLRHREAQLSTIISTTSDGIIILDREGQVCFANPAAAQLFDKSLEELIGYHWGMPVGETTELELVRCDGEIWTVEVKATPIEWLSKPAYIVALRDITERKQFELELQRAKEAAEVANQAKSIFLANMSHELRTPLNVILGFTQVMNRDSSLSSEQFQNLQMISKSGNHLLNLINDVLDLSKIEAGRLTLDESSFDLIALVRSLHEMLSQRAIAKGLQFNLEIAPDVPQYVSTDSNKLRQVLINLLGNAIKFTQKGSVTLRVSVVSSNKQQTTNNQQQTTITFEVSDTGVGIAPAELDTIFDAFVQTQAGRVSHEGTGLGLTITRKFVQLMGGDMTVKSTLGQGSTFSFEIRVRLANAWEVQPTQTQQQAIGLAGGQPPYRILVADDQPENRLVLVKLLTQLGLEVREAKNGQEAVTLWQQWQPHLIWMDIRMPLMDGYAATEQIRSSVEGQSTIIIALTAQASNSDRTLALKAGCNDYVTKPFQEETLFAKMAEHLGLQYLYADSKRLDAVSRYNDDQAQAASLNPENLWVMPPEWMNKLHEAATLCDDEEILHLLEQIPSEHTSLIAGLSHLVRDYQFQPIVQLTQAISSPQTHDLRHKG